MAKLKNSPLQGLSGTLGDLVFRTYGGKTFVYPKPQKPTRQTVEQKKTRIRFSEASQRAKAMLIHEPTRAYYEELALLLNLPNAYTAALRDQMLTMD